MEYLKPYTPLSNPILSDESVDTLSSVAVQDDSIQIGQSPPISTDAPITSGKVLDVVPVPPLPVNVTSEGMDIATKVVDRIVDHRLARGTKPERYLLSFKDQPASENTWVSITECEIFPGFVEALAVRQSRITDRQH